MRATSPLIRRTAPRLRSKDKPKRVMRRGGIRYTRKPRARAEMVTIEEVRQACLDHPRWRKTPTMRPWQLRGKAWAALLAFAPEDVRIHDFLKLRERDLLRMRMPWWAWKAVFDWLRCRRDLLFPPSAPLICTMVGGPYRSHSNACRDWRIHCGFRTIPCKRQGSWRQIPRQQLQQVRRINYQDALARRSPWWRWHFHVRELWG